MSRHIEILLVEDNEDETHFISRSLAELNLDKKLFCTADGNDALDFIFARNEYTDRSVGSSLKLILLDLRLPSIDGLEVLKQIKSDSRTKHIPVVILTSSKEQNDQVIAYRLGANSYMVKPTQYEVFVSEVERIIKYWIFLNQHAAILNS